MAGTTRQRKSGGHPAPLNEQGDKAAAEAAGPRHEYESQLAGMLLVAMPNMSDPRFARSVIYLCAHSAEGAMGLVVNQDAGSVTFPAVIDQLGIKADAAQCDDTPVQVGGPVESSRGFVLHSPDYVLESTLMIDEQFALTATVDVLRAIAQGRGPRQRVLVLGYAGWAAGQLDAEIQANGWLLAPADAEIVFGRDNGAKWELALNKIGVDPRLLSTVAGHA